MMVVGLIISVPIALAQGVPRQLHGEAWLWLVLAGSCNVGGLVITYHAFRRGDLALIVPLISMEGAVAALIAVLAGESLDAGTGIGLLLAVAGVSAASIPGEEKPVTEHRGGHRMTVLMAFTAALVFGVNLYALGRASALLPVAWVVPAARVVGTLVIALPLAVRGSLKITRAAAPFVVTSGVAEVVGLFAYSIGARHGIAVAAVLGSQFAALTVVAAYFLFGERLTRVQLTGVCTIVVGVSLLSLVNA